MTPSRYTLCFLLVLFCILFDHTTKDFVVSGMLIFLLVGDGIADAIRDAVKDIDI